MRRKNEKRGTAVAGADHHTSGHHHHHQVGGVMDDRSNSRQQWDDDIDSEFEVSESEGLDRNNTGRFVSVLDLAKISLVESDERCSTSSGKSFDNDPPSPSHSPSPLAHERSPTANPYESSKPDPFEMDKNVFDKTNDELHDNHSSLILGEAASFLFLPTHKEGSSVPSIHVEEGAVTLSPVLPQQNGDSPANVGPIPLSPSSTPPKQPNEHDPESFHDEPTTSSERDPSPSPSEKSRRGRSRTPRLRPLVSSDEDDNSSSTALSLGNGSAKRLEENNESSNSSKSDGSGKGNQKSRKRGKRSEIPLGGSIPLFEPDVLDNLVEDLFSPTVEEAPSKTRVKKAPLRAKSVEDLFTSGVSPAKRSPRRKATLSAENLFSSSVVSTPLRNDVQPSVNPWAQEPPPETPSYSANHENPWADFISPPKLTQQTVDANSSAQQAHAELPSYADFAKDDDSLTPSHSPNHENPWADLISPPKLTKQTEDANASAPQANLEPTSYADVAKNESSPTQPNAAPPSPAANANSWSRQSPKKSFPSPDKHVESDKDESSSGNAYSQYDPSLDPLYAESPRTPKSFYPLKLSVEAEAPIVLATLRDPHDFSENSKLTERFDDEGSMDLSALLSPNEKKPGDFANFQQPHEAHPLAKKSDEHSLSELGESTGSIRISRPALLIAASLVCLTIFLVAIFAGILGAFVFGSRGKTKEVFVFINTTSAPAGTSPFAPTATPTAPKTPPPTTAAQETVEPTIAPTIAPTTTNSTTVQTEFEITDQELFDTIAAASFDNGASINVSDSPQRRAFQWLQDVDVLTNAERRRQLRCNGGLRRMALSSAEILQRYAMVVFFYATNGDYWIRKDGWLDPSLHECDWLSDYEEGPGCDNVFEHKVVRNLAFNGNNLTGKLAPEIGFLSNLHRLDIIGDPDGAHLTGGLPTELGLLTELDFLKLRGHEFDEELPDRLFETMGLLTVINLSLNKIQGPIPASLVNLTAARKLILSDNNLTDWFPDVIGGMEKLEEVDLRNNFLQGDLPSNVANLTLLEFFDVSENYFRGALPDFSNWSTIVGLDFSNNFFSGSLHDHFASLGELQIFQASSNLLSGEIPPSLSALKSLVEMDISGNDQLKGNITESMCEAFGSDAKVTVDCDFVSCGCCLGC